MIIFNINNIITGNLVREHHAFYSERHELDTQACALGLFADEQIRFNYFALTVKENIV